MSESVVATWFGRSKRHRHSRSVGPGPIGIAYVIFFVVMALTGGSSRPDDVLLLILRPISVLCLFVILVNRSMDWRIIRTLLLMLAALAFVHVLQLVPLPPAIWKALPVGVIYGDVLRTLGEGASWRSLSVAPDATWNSLVALLVPLTTMLFYVALPPESRIRMLWAILLLAAASMALGILQFVGGEASGLYWHRVSGRGQLIGFFTNRNHQGALLGMALPILRAWMIQPAGQMRDRNIRLYIGLGAMAVILVYAFVLGSRAGLALTAMGFFAAFLVDPSLGLRGWPQWQRWLLLGLICVAIAALVVVVLNADRAVSLGRISGVRELNEEGRLRALPALLRILEETWSWGVGFGAFVPVYATFEPAQLLKPTYFNHAHNDLIELAITGGVPGLLIFGTFFLWVAQSLFRAFRHENGRDFPTALGRAAAFAIVIAFAASLTDYPLRTPLMSSVFAVLCCCLASRPDAIGNVSRTGSARHSR